MERKTFRELYEAEKRKPSAAQQFVADVASLTKRSESTVRMWLANQQKPDELTKSVIAKRFGQSAETLFP